MGWLGTIAGLGLALTLSACMHRGGPWPDQGSRGGAGYGPMMGEGRGPGMMGGESMAMWRDLERLDLSAEQRTQIAQIQEDLRRQHQAMMQGMHSQAGPHGGWGDEAGERQRYEQMSAVHQAMFESQLVARKRILDVLTPGQREQLGRSGPAR